jgi:hypothetical protein
MKSARVDLHHRAIVYERGGVLVLLWVDKHDDAYRWARNRVVEINPTTSSVQVSDLGLIEIAQENANKSAVETLAIAKLFRAFSDKDLSKVGVPESLFPAVRAMSTEFDLEAAKSGIPATDLERPVRLVTLALVAVLDPMAVALLLAAGVRARCAGSF